MEYHTNWCLTCAKQTEGEPYCCERCRDKDGWIRNYVEHDKPVTQPLVTKRLKFKCNKHNKVKY